MQVPNPQNLIMPSPSCGHMRWMLGAKPQPGGATAYTGLAVLITDFFYIKFYFYKVFNNIYISDKYNITSTSNTDRHKVVIENIDVNSTKWYVNNSASH